MLGLITHCKENIQAAFALRLSIDGDDDINKIAVFKILAVDLAVGFYTFQC